MQAITAAISQDTYIKQDDGLQLICIDLRSLLWAHIQRERRIW